MTALPDSVSASAGPVQEPATPKSPMETQDAVAQSRPPAPKPSLPVGPPPPTLAPWGALATRERRPQPPAQPSTPCFAFHSKAPARPPRPRQWAPHDTPLAPPPLPQISPPMVSACSRLYAATARSAYSNVCLTLLQAPPPPLATPTAQPTWTQPAGEYTHTHSDRYSHAHAHLVVQRFLLPYTVSTR